MTPEQIIAGLRQVQEALSECDDAMGYMSDYDIPLCLPDHVKEALSQLPALIAAVDEQQNTIAGLREDLRQLIRVVLNNPADAAGFIQANYPREFLQ